MDRFVAPGFFLVWIWGITSVFAAEEISKRPAEDLKQVVCSYFASEVKAAYFIVKLRDISVDANHEDLVVNAKKRSTSKVREKTVEILEEGARLREERRNLYDSFVSALVIYHSAKCSEAPINALIACMIEDEQLGSGCMNKYNVRSFREAMSSTK